MCTFSKYCTMERAIFRVHGSWFMVLIYADAPNDLLRCAFLAEFILCFRLICFRSAQARSHKPSGFFTDDRQSRAWLRVIDDWTIYDLRLIGQLS